MVSQESIFILSICVDSQSTEKSRGGESTFSSKSNSNLANPKLVPRTLTSFSEKSNHFAIKGRLTKGSSKPIASSYTKSNNAISSVACLRKRLAEEEISERVSDLIVSSRREGTLSTYSSAWNKWVSWCVEQNVGPVRCNVNWILDFLAFCLSQDMNIGQYIHIGQQLQLCIAIFKEDLLESTRRSVLLLQVCSIIDHLSLNIILSGMLSWYWIT